MKSYNKDMKNGYNKFRKTINNNHVFRKANNTLSEINNYALPVLTTASAFAPQFAPAFGSVAVALKSGQTLTGALKNKRI